MANKRHMGRPMTKRARLKSGRTNQVKTLLAKLDKEREASRHRVGECQDEGCARCAKYYTEDGPVTEHQWMSLLREASMNESTAVALDHSECIKSASNFGETVYSNICTGAQTIVPWGSVDYVGAFMAMIIAIGVASVLFGAVALAIREH